jgi:hypothetical protein
MKLFCCLLLALPFCAAAQKIKSTDYDKTVKQPLVETEPQLIVNSADAKLSLALATSDSNVYLETSGTAWGSATIDANDPLLLTLSNGSVLKLKSTGLQSFNPDPNGSTYRHEYKAELTDIASLSKYDLVAIRKYMFTEFTDLKIPAVGASKLKSLSMLFLNEVNKTAVAAKPLRHIELRDIQKFVGDSVIFCGNIFITRFFESFQNQASILDFQTTLSAPKARAIIWKEDQRKFGNLPKSFYTAKQVCVKGLVYLYDNTPYVQISDRSQIRVTSPLTTDEAKFFVGDSITLTGIVEKMSFSPALNNTLLLKLRTPGCRQEVKLVVGGTASASFTGMPADYYLNKTVQVTGRLTLQENSLQMTLPGKESILMAERRMAN